MSYIRGRQTQEKSYFIWLSLCIVGALLMSCSLLTGVPEPLRNPASTQIASTQALPNLTETALSLLQTEASRPTLTPLPSLTPVVPSATATVESQPGSISGKLSFPSEFIPPLRVVAIGQDSKNVYYVDTQKNQPTYHLTIPTPGKYVVLAYTNGLVGGYTQMVPCGLSVNCPDHSLIVVMVTAGQETTGVDPGDWYAPDGFFPPNPVP